MFFRCYKTLDDLLTQVAKATWYSNNYHGRLYSNI